MGTPEWAAKLPVPFYKEQARIYNAIKQIQVIPCAVPVAVYFEAAREGVWTMVQSVVSPDPKELYHQIVGESFYHTVKNSMVKGGLVEPVELSPQTRGLFLAADLVDVSLWYMFLFGSAVKGLIDFSTHVQRYSGCTPEQRLGFFQGGGYINAIGDDGRFYTNLFQDVNPPGITVSEGKVIIQPGKFGFTSATCKFETFGGATQVPTVTAVRNNANGLLLDQSASNPDSSGIANLAHTWAKVKNGTVNVVELQPVSAYTGGINLPLHEAFRSGDRWYCHLYQQP